MSTRKNKIKKKKKKNTYIKEPFICDTTVASLQASRNESDTDCVILRTRYVVFLETKESQQNVPKGNKGYFKALQENCIRREVA